MALVGKLVPIEVGGDTGNPVVIEIRETLVDPRPANG